MAVINQIRRLWQMGLSFSGAKWLILGTIIGLVCGVLGFVFVAVVDLGAAWILGDLVGYEAADPKAGQDRGVVDISQFNPWILLGVLGFGALISAWLRHRFSSAHSLQGTVLAVDAFHRHRGLMKMRDWLTRFVTTIITLITGASAGREGPIAMLGAGCGSAFGSYWKLSRRDRRVLLVAGMAGGIAAVFRAPLAGTLFAAEVLYAESDLEADTIIPGFIAAVTAFCTYGLIDAFLYANSGGSLSVALFQITDNPSFEIKDVLQLGAYTVIALCVAALMWFMRLQFSATERLFKALPIPQMTKPVLGAMLTGVLAIILFFSLQPILADSFKHMPLAVLGSGYNVIQDAFDQGQLNFEQEMNIVLALACVAIGKICTSCLTVGSGNSGGLFGPSMVIGASAGAAIGFALRLIVPPSFVPPMSACIVMGMASALTTNFRTPLAALLMVTELSSGYELLLPAMWVCSLSFILSGRRSLIASQVPTQLHSSAHRGHFFSDVLSGIKVEQVFNPERRVHTLHPESSLDECKRLITDTHQNIYPIVDNDGHMTGIFSMNDLRSFLYDDSLGLVAVAQDIATDHIIAIQPKDSLATTMRRFTELNVDALPVVDDEEEMTFLGMLSRREVITHYNKVVDDLRAMRKAEGYDEVTAHHATSQNP